MLVDPNQSPWSNQGRVLVSPGLQTRCVDWRRELQRERGAGRSYWVREETVDVARWSCGGTGVYAGAGQADSDQVELRGDTLDAGPGPRPYTQPARREQGGSAGAGPGSQHPRFSGVGIDSPIPT